MVNKANEVVVHFKFYLDSNTINVTDSRTRPVQCYDINGVDPCIFFGSDTDMYDVYVLARLAAFSHNQNNIKQLPDDVVFVFGSNESGYHGGGAAHVALKCFGAKWGMGFGSQGQSYAIPTKDRDIEKLSSAAVFRYICDFVKDIQNSERDYFVTELGCGLAGFSHNEIAKMFMIHLKKQPKSINRVIMPRAFIQVLNNGKTISYI